MSGRPSGNEPDYHPGDRVEYLAEPVFDGIIRTGDVGSVVKVEDGWVFARWPRSGVHSVPLANVRRARPDPQARAADPDANRRIRELIGEEKPPLPGGRARDPYMQEGCHPDVVERVWDVLGAAVPPACRAQARGTPVLAHPHTDRVFVAAHGTAYALWLTTDDFVAARTAGLQTVMEWSGGRTTDLARVAGHGWVWGKWHALEDQWVHRSYLAGGPDP